MHCPKKENSDKGTVDKPQTHIVDVAVKKTSINGIARVCAIGKLNKAVPMVMVKMIERIRRREGEKRAARYLDIIVSCSYRISHTARIINIVNKITRRLK